MGIIIGIQLQNIAVGRHLRDLLMRDMSHDNIFGNGGNDTCFPHACKECSGWNIHGIGVKSADCIRLLSLRHKAFPVDVNVARIVTRLGWVKLQPLNGVEFHLINSKSLPPPEKHEHGEQQASMVASGGFLLPNDGYMPNSQYMYQHQIEISSTAEMLPIHNCEPIVEMPQSPENEYKEAPKGQEDSYKDIEDIVPEGVHYDGEIDLCSNHTSSRHPITIPRECIGMLDRRIVYFGQTRHDIEECFKKGYVCVRGFHRRTRTPMRICSTLHVTNTIKKVAVKKEGGEKQARTSPEGNSKEKKAHSPN
ncbi:hypothetical protein HU200_012003 [Digitaria exilis]|uniref:Demeter RRM-fold domain-containing protein n=1 Tax=Digitaria exilis TaxID=1010633 RepID=A0A835FEY7_9POAL|nr:hypothetical protein HU200_012003 [Digitaria exilis]